MGRLSTHILDTAHGLPAAGVPVELWEIMPDGARVLASSAITNTDGRTDEPMLAGDAYRSGTYELIFHMGAHFRAGKASEGRPLFLDVIPVRFTIDASEDHYHVPLLVSPWAYSTYRGS